MMKLSKTTAIAVFAVLVLSAFAACKRGPDDPTLAANVKAKLAADPTLSAAAISVEAKDGAVTLNGTVNSDADKNKAGSIASGVEGVKSVINNLTVKPVVTFSPDAELKRDVTANLQKYGVSGITADVANGEVTLKGDIPRAKLQDAMKAANEAKPKRVINQLNIK